jgi:hypothetical protein
LGRKALSPRRRLPYPAWVPSTAALLLIFFACAHAAPGESSIAREADCLRASVEGRRRMRELGAEAPIVMTIDVNVPDELRATLTEALRYLYAVRADRATPLHRQAFGGQVDGRLYLMWLQRRVEHVKMGSCFPGPAAGCYASHSKTVTLTSARLDKWQAIALLLHEAAHADAPGHAPCGYGDEEPPSWDRLGRHGRDRSSTSSCDREITGAYGVAAIALHNIAAFCRGCSPIERQLLQRQGFDQSKGVADESARRALNEDLIGWIAAVPASERPGGSCPVR